MNCEKILNAPSALPNPTVKCRLKTCPALKFDDATRGCAALLGQKVKKPAWLLTTVALPTIASAVFATDVPPQAPRACWLRIVPADIATGQKTAVSAGKYLTRKLFVEVITDGQGYSATRIEYQVTRWLSILSSVSTIGRTSANVRVSKDY